ncbi:MAG: hypothetical protein JXO51_05150, partial [Candidatus Aminicenantes bacterium]|nr:hypothetical protein [Candidatus Aminicenantes bacterium]
MPIERRAPSGESRPRETLLPVLWACASPALLAGVVILHLHFTFLPLFFLALGFVSYAWNGRKALLLFLLLLPLVNATPDLFFNGYPYNTMGVQLFYLAGLLGASLAKGERPELRFPGRGIYLLFLALLGISALFVLLRWSNLGLPGLALLRDTPVATSGERLSFAVVFPAITLALFSLSPFLVSLLRRQGLGARETFLPLKAGFSLSFLLALFQRLVDADFMSQGWWGRKMEQVNGGFSDFNAFGFFAGAMFLWQALELTARWTEDGERREGSAAPRPSALARMAGPLFLVVALAAVFLSGCRTAFLFVLAALVRLLLARRPPRRLKAAAVLLLAFLLLIAGGTLGKRLRL